MKTICGFTLILLAFTDVSCQPQENPQVPEVAVSIKEGSLNIESFLPGEWTDHYRAGTFPVSINGISTFGLQVRSADGASMSITPFVQGDELWVRIQTEFPFRLDKTSFELSDHERKISIVEEGKHAFLLSRNLSKLSRDQSKAEQDWRPQE